MKILLITLLGAAAVLLYMGGCRRRGAAAPAARLASHLQTRPDHNNYGGPDMYWVYYCITADGHEFTAGGKAPPAP